MGAREKKYDVAHPDEWVRPVHRKFKLMCCDCALVHTIDFRILDGGVELRFARNERATAAARRAFKFAAE